MRVHRHRGVLDVFIFFSSPGGCKNSTWLKQKCQRSSSLSLHFFILSHLPSCVTSLLVSPSHHSLLLFSLFPLLSRSPLILPLIFISPCGISGATCCWPSPGGVSSMAGPGSRLTHSSACVCVCLCVDEMEDCNVFLHA